MLQPSEAIVLKEASVTNGGAFASFTDELVLTNQSLLLIKKNLFGGVKGVFTFPLSHIKVYNNQAQAFHAKTGNGDALDVYFIDHHEQFRFQQGGKRKVLTWAAKINEVVTGQPSQLIEERSSQLPGVERVAVVLSDTFKIFKSKFNDEVAVPVAATGKCSGCGAPIRGNLGHAGICDYCGSGFCL